MSCFNCYNSRRVDEHLIDKVLEQGQRLRSAMVQTILHNDPLNTEVVYSQGRNNVKLDDLSEETVDKVRAFLQGDAMSREDEVTTLETLRSMSAIDLCRATDRTYRSNEPCDCPTCRGLNGDSDALNYLKFVDSLKVTVNSVVLNEAGDKKVSGVGTTCFLQYQIPDNLLKNQRIKAKVDSGLDFGNVVRLCARKSHHQAIIFKQSSIHDVANLSRVKLKDVAIKFKLSFRAFKQKQPVTLGFATFNFKSFEEAKNFSCHQELAVKLDENTPLVVGALRVSIQLGCGRLYFGKEFIDAITNNKENSVALASDEVSSVGSDVPKVVTHPHNVNQKLQHRESPKPVVQRPKSVAQASERSELVAQKPKQLAQVSETSEPVAQRSKSIAQISQRSEPVAQRSKPVAQIPERSEPVVQKPKQILFGYVYVSEAKFAREVLNSYLTCQMFGQDVCCSKLVAFDSNPVYSFSQQIPLVYDDDLLAKLRENFMVVEFFEKGQIKEFLIGIAKLPLHQFYLTYRNPQIAQYLAQNPLPWVGVDGWETVFNPIDDEVVGQAQILVALGTKTQIDNLEIERGFKRHIVRAKPKITKSTKNEDHIVAAKPINKTVDVGVQSTMEAKTDIETLLNQIVAQKPQNIHVENSTNTEPDVKSTSQLLDSLQKALSLDSPGEKSSFKAHVVINSALHLPSRRKCKSRRSKGRTGKHEDVLPSTYVTFETSKGDLKMTPIVPKSTNPKWEFRCDVDLPIEYLTNNQKFLVFKIWRKATNTTMLPNLQTDIVIGFATVDLTVLAAGLPSVQGWFNINDLSNKCNGQINIHVIPLENIASYHREDCCGDQQQPQTSDSVDEPSELLGRALKRKFTELDEITQRLRLRLSKVTNDESDTSNDEIADEFERDINTLCVEDDFDMIDFEKEAHSFNLNHVKEVGLLQTDKNLVESKQKIDVLLEKLSLISAENSSRYVSGCSDGRAESILNELDCNSRPNLYSSGSFGRDMVQKFGSSLTSETCSVSDRAAPEGELTDNLI